MGLVLSEDGQTIDERLTRKLFGLPGGPRGPKSFSPIGDQVEIISYKTSNYVVVFRNPEVGNNFGRRVKLLLLAWGRERYVPACEYRFANNADAKDTGHKTGWISAK
jgi:hypothetical protein